MTEMNAQLRDAIITALRATTAPDERAEIAREVRALVQDERFRLDHDLAVDVEIVMQPWGEKDVCLFGAYVPPIEPLNLAGVRDAEGKMTTFTLPVMLREKLQHTKAGAMVAIFYVGQKSKTGMKKFEVIG
jgi:hypothetical protein